MIRIKICGLTNAADGLAAVDAGADAIGFVFADSCRRVSPETAARIGRRLPPFVVKVGVFVNPTLEEVARVAKIAGLHVVQLHGGEDNRFVQAVRRMGWTVLKAVSVRDDASLACLERIDPDGWLLDAYDPEQAGGTGKTFDWTLARQARARLEAADRTVPVVLAGGLHADNVARAVEAVGPYAVDVSSGVERAPGKKDPDKMIRFVQRARGKHGHCGTVRGA